MEKNEKLNPAFVNNTSKDEKKKAICGTVSCKEVVS